MTEKDRVLSIMRNFNLEGTTLTVEEFGSGKINDTFLVTIDSEKNDKIILQKINKSVFKDPQLVMHNMRVVTDHIKAHPIQNSNEKTLHLKVPKLYRTKDADYFIDNDDCFWRAMSFIDFTITYDTITDLNQAREAGFVVGQFQFLISDIETDLLNDTLKGFHITPEYLEIYDHAEATNNRNDSSDIKFCKKFIEKRRKWASVLEDAKNNGELKLRPIHGDPKISNILFDRDSKRGIGIVDLDTVKPGLIQYDTGDLLRSSCNTKGEDTEDLQDISFDTDICREIFQGYLSRAGRFLSPADYKYLFDSIRLIAFELGLRYFTDFIQGDIYFKTSHKDQNLIRALVQFKLVEDIEKKEKSIRSIIKILKVRPPFL